MEREEKVEREEEDERERVHKRYSRPKTELRLNAVCVTVLTTAFPSVLLLMFVTSVTFSAFFVFFLFLKNVYSVKNLSTEILG